jgi:hypothetical protein
MTCTFTRFAACCAVVATTAGCAGSSEYMREVSSAAPLSSPANMAAVVFIRPSGIGALANVAILDQNGTWIGEALSQSYFAVSLPPGEYMFLGSAFNTSLLKASLLPAHVYYVEVRPTFPPGYVMEAITPRSDDWRKIGKWLREVRRLEPLPTGAVDMSHDDVMARVASARDSWNNYTEEEKEARTLRADDGVPGAGAPAVQAPAVAAH